MLLSSLFLNRGEEASLLPTLIKTSESPKKIHTHINYYLQSLVTDILSLILYESLQKGKGCVNL